MKSHRKVLPIRCVGLSCRTTAAKPQVFLDLVHVSEGQGYGWCWGRMWYGTVLMFRELDSLRGAGCALRVLQQCGALCTHLSSVGLDQ